MSQFVVGMMDNLMKVKHAITKALAYDINQTLVTVYLSNLFIPLKATL